MKRLFLLAAMACVLSGCGNLTGDEMESKVVSAVTHTEKNQKEETGKTTETETTAEPEETTETETTAEPEGTEESETSVEPEEAVLLHEITAEAESNFSDILEGSGLQLYGELPFSYENESWAVETYVGAEKDEQGEFLFDDNCRFVIRAASGQESYTFFDEQVQLGMPEADVFTDLEGNLHLVIQDVRTAGYLVTDYVYDKENGKFIGRKVMDYGGINYMGRCGKY